MSNNIKCPICGCDEILGKYASFWVQIDEDGNDTAPNFDDHQSSTELTGDMMCSKCAYEFDDDDLENEDSEPCSVCYDVDCNGQCMGDGLMGG